MDQALRVAKENHVKGHDGSSIFECSLFLTLTLFSYFIWRTVTHRWLSGITSKIVSSSVEFVILVVPLLLSVITPWLWEITAMLALIATLAAVFPPGLFLTASGKTPALKTRHLPFITTFRGFLQITTMLCILAVDFNSFPRKFAKTETYGTSLMDMGVGAIIFSGGLVAGPRLAIQQNSMSKLAKTIKSCFPVLALGLIRTLLTKSVNYQEHVSEYGIHWNFFMTLGLVPIVVTLFETIVPRLFSLTLTAFLLMGVYTAQLQYTGLETYILTAKRDNLFSMNREGIFSLYGYTALFLIAADIGIQVRKYSAGKLIKYLVICLVSFSLTSYLTINVMDIKVSRRLANSSYVLWITASSLYHLLGCAVIDYVFRNYLGDTSSPLIYQNINQNQLVVFLFANLLTGLINLTINTLNVSDFGSFCYMIVYFIAILSVASGLNIYKKLQ